MICKKFDEKRTKSDQNSKILMFTQNQRTFWGGLKNLPCAGDFDTDFSH